MLFSLGMAKRGGPARGPQVKNAGRTDLFNPLTRISPQLARASSGAGQAGPQTWKQSFVLLVGNMDFLKVIRLFYFILFLLFFLSAINKD